MDLTRQNLSELPTRNLFALAHQNKVLEYTKKDRAALIRDLQRLEVIKGLETNEQPSE